MGSHYTFVHRNYIGKSGKHHHRNQYSCGIVIFLHQKFVPEWREAAAGQGVLDQDDRTVQDVSNIELISLYYKTYFSSLLTC